MVHFTCWTEWYLVQTNQLFSIIYLFFCSRNCHFCGFGWRKLPSMDCTCGSTVHKSCLSLVTKQAGGLYIHKEKQAIGRTKMDELVLRSSSAMPMIDKKRKGSAYLDEEAEESDKDHGEDDLHLQLDDDEDCLNEPVDKKSQFSKIKDPELLSESSTNSDILKMDSNSSQVETCTLALTRDGSTAPSSCVSNLSSTSSMGAILQSEPRWTPFQDRVDSTGSEITSADNSIQDTSPTASQQARKKLGLEGLFDGTDPDMEDVDDVVGLCSGKFVSQVDRTLSPAMQVNRFLLEFIVKIFSFLKLRTL